jgi:hypothetical protein
MVLIGIGCELALLSGLVYLPFLHGLFGTAALGPREAVWLLIWPPAMFLTDEVRKATLRRRNSSLAHGVEQSA